MSIYKDCDIRGVYGNELGEQEAYLIGRACAGLIPEAGLMAVGGDVRTSTPILKHALIEGLTAGGAAVCDLGTIPTPAFNFGIDYLRAIGGVMVTASHNPAPYNGFKIVLGNLPLATEQIRLIEHQVLENQFHQTPGPSVVSRPIVVEYLDFLYRLLDPPSRPLRVVVDCGNGAYSSLAPEFLASLGYQVIPLFCDPDGTFPNRSPNPSEPGTLAALSRTVREEKADAGIAFDGDGDRVVFVDNSGRVLPAEQAMIFFLRSRLPALPPGEKFVYDQKSSRVISREITHLGGIPVEERSGYTFIKSRLIRENALMAAEISGHYFFRELGRDDGLYAAGVLLAYLSRQNSSLSEITSSYPPSHVTQDIRIPVRDHQDVFTTISRSLPGVPISRLDGIRAEWPDGWALIRQSVTEPVYTLRFEADNPDDLPQLVSRFLESMPDLAKEVQTKLSHE